MAPHGERETSKEGFRGRDPDEGPQNIWTHTHTHTTWNKIAVKTRKYLAYFSIHKSFFIHAYYQKLVYHCSPPNKKSPKPSLTSLNRTISPEYFKNGVNKTPENKFTIDYNFSIRFPFWTDNEYWLPSLFWSKKRLVADRLWSSQNAVCFTQTVTPFER